MDTVYVNPQIFEVVLLVKKQKKNKIKLFCLKVL